MTQVTVDTSDGTAAFRQLAEAMAEHEDVCWWQIEDMLTIVREEAQFNQ